MLVIELYFNKVKKSFNIGRGANILGFEVRDLKMSSDFRVKDRGIEYLRKNIDRKKILSASVYEKKILIFEFSGQDQIWFYYIDHFLHLLYLPTKGDHQNKLSRIESQANTMMPLEDFEYEKFVENEIRKLTKRKSSTVEKLIKNISSDVKKIEDALSLKNEVIALEEIDETFDLKIKKIKFNPGMSIWDKKNKIFSTMKRLVMVLNNQTKRLDEINSKEQNLTINVNKLPKIQIKIDRYETQREFDTWKIESLNIQVGKSDAVNDQLIKKMKNTDLWLHPADVPGPHVIIKNYSKSQDKANVLNIIGNLLIHHYACNCSQLLTSSKKELKRLPGKKGLVSVKTGAKIKITIDDEWGNKVSKVV